MTLTDPAEAITEAIAADALVAAASSPDHFSPMLDVGGSPVHVPAKRLAAELANHRFPASLSTEKRSPTEFAEVAEFLDQTGTVSYEASARGGRSAALFQEVAEKDAIIVVELEYGNEFTVTVAAASRALARRYMDGVMTMIADFPPPPPEPELPYNIVPVHFWMQDPMSGGGYSRRRNIEVASFDDVRGNYPAKLQAELEGLMALDDPSGGKLVLLHGPPGTGKTRLILSLISEWRNWCGASVVTDADKLFEDATYLNSIVFNAEGQRWLLLVIEDGDEFMNVGSRDSKGQAIARLLNLADGIVGQGIRLLTLISTNVDMNQLNPAVIRNGRCMANLHFDAFPADEAGAWMAAHGHEDVKFEAPVSLADLYAHKAALEGKAVAEVAEPAEEPAEA